MTFEQLKRKILKLNAGSLKFGALRGMILAAKKLFRDYIKGPLTKLLVDMPLRKAVTICYENGLDPEEYVY